jgi:Zn-dependent M28 family amino/carboxypeptidase
MIEMHQNFDKKTLKDNLHEHVEHLSVKIGDRHLWKEHSLDKAAEYIESVFRTNGDAVRRQTFTCYGKSVSNLIAEQVGDADGAVLIGAHYDTVPGSPGADDNASGIAGMLEIARLSRAVSHKNRFIFTAFVNEEPPCFGTPNMGSMVYANSLRQRGLILDVMICLEMIGYFREDERQQYPFPGMELLFPRTANFLAVVGNFKSLRYVSALKKGIRRNAEINVRSLVAPEQVAGINRSDHFAFWHHGSRAVMVTDTAYFRNKNYHQETDTIDTLNFDAMTEVVKGLFYALRTL